MMGGVGGGGTRADRDENLGQKLEPLLTKPLFFFKPGNRDAGLVSDEVLLFGNSAKS